MINWSSLRRSITGQIEHIRSTLQRLLPDLHADVTAATAQEAYRHALEAADRHTKTGALVRSLKLRKLGRLGEERYEIYHDLRAAPHALFVHWGTKAHEIRPRYKKALRFVPTGANHFVFAKRVWHPGYKGDPYLVNARSSVVRGFTRIAAQSWANVTRRIRRT
jgi:hypothetical protein